MTAAPQGSGRVSLELSCHEFRFQAGVGNNDVYVVDADRQFMTFPSANPAVAGQRIGDESSRGAGEFHGRVHHARRGLLHTLPSGEQRLPKLGVSMVFTAPRGSPCNQVP